MAGASRSGSRAATLGQHPDRALDVDRPVAVGLLRRDFPALLNLVRAHALLHQATRENTADGAVMATLEDYAVVRGFVADLIADELESSVPLHIRETVNAVESLFTSGKEETSLAAVAASLN